jgi:NADPH-dependent glutamate synthase beta subunit-like oxidoreductase
VATVKSLLEDLPVLDAAEKRGADTLKALLKSRGVRVVSYADWQEIDAAEVRRGETAGKPREKFARREEMLRLLEGLE